MPRVLTAGKRTQLVTFQSYTEGSPDATGIPAKTYASEGNAYVAISFIGGAEVEVGGQVRYMPTYQVRMLKIDAPSIVPEWRMLRGSEVYEVVSKDETDLDNAEIVLVVARNESAGVS